MLDSDFSCQILYKNCCKYLYNNMDITVLDESFYLANIRNFYGFKITSNVIKQFPKCKKLVLGCESNLSDDNISKLTHLTNLTLFFQNNTNKCLENIDLEYLDIVETPNITLDGIKHMKKLKTLIIEIGSKIDKEIGELDKNNNFLINANISRMGYTEID